MERKSVNPVSWSLKLGFDQGHLIKGHQRVLLCSGQDAVDANGNPQHPGDMGAQLDHALDNLQAVLAGANMKLANIIRLNVYTTDMPQLLKNFGRITARIGNSDVRSRAACSEFSSCRCRRFSSCSKLQRLTDASSHRRQPSPCLRFLRSDRS